jgi:hypothetical protein
MLDRDLAQFYGVETRILKRSVKSNSDRFPPDFMFELTKAENELLRSKIYTSKTQETLKKASGSVESADILRSTFRISKAEKRGGDRYLSFAFSELGIAMLSSVLNTDRAIQVFRTLMRAFFHPRHYSESPSEIVQKLDDLNSKIDELNNQFRLNLKQQAAINTQLSTAGRSQEKPALPAPSFTSPTEATVQEVLKAVTDFFGIKIQDLRKPGRAKPIPLARQIAIFLIRERTKLSLKTIGTHFAGQDHTTVLYAYRKIKNCLGKNEEIREIIFKIQTRLGINAN